MVGTPGRLEDLISTGKLELSSCRFFVLDECVSVGPICSSLLGVTVVSSYQPRCCMYRHSANSKGICTVWVHV